MTETMKCPKCGYEWTPKVADPKMCPRCPAYLKPLPKVEPVENSEIVPTQTSGLVYCPFCGAKLPLQTMPIPSEEQPTEKEPEPVEPEVIVPSEEQPSEEPSEEETEEEPSEGWESEEEESLIEKGLKIMPIVVQLQTDIEGFLEIALNPHIYHFPIDAQSLNYLQESFNTLCRLTDQYQSAEHWFYKKTTTANKTIEIIEKKS